MKQKHCRNLIQSPLIALALTAGTAFAGTTTEPAPAPAPKEDIVSGVLNLDFNSHFISYGADVWGDGDSMSAPEFNPSLELAFALPADFTFTLGTWWDVVPASKKSAAADDSAIGGRLQEVDVWAGLAYTIGDFTTKVTYQSWMYGSDTEDILDVTFSYACLLSPTLTIHNRLDQGAAAGDEGTVLVLGLSHSIEAGPVTISFPFNVGYFVDDDYHNFAEDGGSDNGFGYGSIGVTASYDLAFLEAVGDWSIHGGLTYYVTDQDVIPGNAEGDFLTANVGLTLKF